MSVKLKFEDYKETTTDQHGFQFVKNGIMLGTEEKGCLVCGRPTKYIEVCSEAHFCSDECVQEFNKQLADFERLETYFQEEIERGSTTSKVTEAVANDCT